MCHASGLPFDGNAPVAAPATRRVYGNPAFELLAALVEERSGLGFATYLSEAVLRPLGMHHTTLTSSPAWGAASTVSDMLRFAAELLTPGRVLAPELLEEAASPQLPGLSGVLPGFGQQRPNPWGMGFEVKGRKHPHWTPDGASPQTFGHFGQSGCFLWVDPVAATAVTALSDLDFGRWALSAWPELGESALRAAARR